METIDKRKKVTRLIKFIGIFIIIAGLLWLVQATLWGNNTPTANEGVLDSAGSTQNILPAQQLALLKQDEVLHAHLEALQKMDNEYASLLTDSANKDGLTDINKRILLVEEAFRTSIDSVAKVGVSASNETDERLFVNMISSFRLALDNRRLINNLRSAMENDSTSPSQQQRSMLGLKNDLLNKDTRIAYLENILATLQNENTNVSSTPAIVSKEDAGQSQEKDNKIASLTAIVNTLQKEYDRVSRQLLDAKKSTESNDNSTKSRNISLENEIEELNTELRLAKVDCNLARVDATQIISTSKQRKILLSEALNILNSLSNSNNASLQKKIKDKIVRLNQVATNYRD